MELAPFTVHQYASSNIRSRVPQPRHGHGPIEGLRVVELRPPGHRAGVLRSRSGTAQPGAAASPLRDGASVAMARALVRASPKAST